MNGQTDYAGIWALVVGLLIAASLFWHMSRSRSILENWAQVNGYQILESSYRNLMRGPFFLRSSKEQTVYRIKVRDQEGRIRSGWLRYGGWFFGLWSEKADVIWDN